MRILSIFVMIMSAVSMWGQRQPEKSPQETDLLQIKKLCNVHMAIKNLYVDSVDQGKMVEDAINGILERLDPHSTYSNPEQTRKLNESIKGNFEGIGVQFNMLQDTLLVIQTIEKGPSERAGIQAGDRILTVDDRPIAGVKMERDSIMKLLRGAKGSKVRLGVLRRPETKLRTFTVVRDKIPVKTLTACYMIEPEIGYIHLGNFGETSGEEVRSAIVELKKKGMKRLIFDLQQNGGGALSAAIDVASQFLEKGSLVVYTEGRTIPQKRYHVLREGEFCKGDLIVLVDEYTASAAEIVSGAVQDYDRGTIIGRRTFGKGLVQACVDLPDGSMLRLTTSHYYIPSGRCVQKPYEKGRNKEYARDVENRFTHGELSCIDSIHLDSTKVYRTLREGRIVYGGGGVMPDIFVPLDTTRYTKYLTAIRRKRILDDEVLRFIDGQRKALQKKYSKFDNYIANFEVPESLVDSVLVRASREKVEPADSTELANTIPDLRFLLKSLIAYDIWDKNEYARLVNMRSDIVQTALRRWRE